MQQFAKKNNGPQSKHSESSYGAERQSTHDKHVAPSLKPTRVIGNGAFGYVFEAFDNNRQCKVALKRT